MAKTYDLKGVVCTVGGVAISGYGESDAIGLEWEEDIVSMTVTADGTHVYSRNNNRGLMVTVTLMQTSFAVNLLANLLNVQHGEQLPVAPPLIIGLPFFLTDAATGDTVTGNVVMVSRPAPSKGKTVGEVQFRMHMSDPVVINGLLNAFT